jgi:hypothetical protein
MGVLNEKGINEILERFEECKMKARRGIIEAGFGPDAADLVAAVIDNIYKAAHTDNCKMWSEDELVLELEKIGIDKWGKEAKNKMYGSGLKTRADYRRVMDIAAEWGVLRNGDEEADKDGPIYKGWD